MFALRTTPVVDRQGVSRRSLVDPELSVVHNSRHKLWKAVRSIAKYHIHVADLIDSLSETQKVCIRIGYFAGKMVFFPGH